MRSADNGEILDALPLGATTNGWVFSTNTTEAFSSNSDGTLTIVKEHSPTSFGMEENLKTMSGAKTLTLDARTDHIILITAECGPPPPPAATPSAGGRGRRGGNRECMLPGSFSLIAVGKP